MQVLGAGYDCNLAGCAVPAIHSAHESFFQATPGYIGVRDDLHRKATFTISFSEVMLPDANFLSSRAQNRVFCALFGSGTPVFGLFEHKIGVFVLGLPLSAASGRVIADIFEILPRSGRGRVA